MAGILAGHVADLGAAIWPRVLEEKSLANAGFLSRLAAQGDGTCKIPLLIGDSTCGQNSADAVCTIARCAFQGMCGALPAPLVSLPPVGLILCAEKDQAMAKYALEGLSNTVLTAEYRTTLPLERVLAEEIARTRRQLDVQRQDAFRSPPRGTRFASNLREPSAGWPHIDIISKIREFRLEGTAIGLL